MVALSQMTFKDVVPWLIGANVVISILLLGLPDLLIKVNDKLAKWIPTDKIDTALNRERNIDLAIIGVRKIIGYVSVFVAVALARRRATTAASLARRSGWWTASGATPGNSLLCCSRLRFQVS